MIFRFHFFLLCFWLILSLFCIKLNSTLRYVTVPVASFTFCSGIFLFEVRVTICWWLPFLLLGNFIYFELHFVSSCSRIVTGTAISSTFFQDSIPDIVYSLVWILEDKNGAASSIAADVAIKLVSTIPNALLKPFILDLSHALSCLLARQIQTSVACATALNLILSNVTSKSEEALWEILKKTEVVLHLIDIIRDFSGAMNPVEYIQPSFSLLSTILSRWPLSRFPVWSDAKLMEALYDMYAKPDFSVRAEVLKLYSAIGNEYRGIFLL